MRFKLEMSETVSTLPGRPDQATNWHMARACAIIFPLAALIGIYGPDVGHGFLGDDFGWLDAEVRTLQDLRLLLTRHNGFYRPVVSVSFAASRCLFGVEPLWYGTRSEVFVLALRDGRILRVVTE